MHTTETATATTTATAGAQGTHVAPKPATTRNATSQREHAPKARKSAKGTASKKTATKKAGKPAIEKVSAAGRANSKKALVLDMLRREAPGGRRHAR